ncbi:MAG: sulfatase-like hydrolase/transferase [Planctomycetota bacterium]
MKPTLAWLGLLVSLAWVGTYPSPALGQQTRPNILLIYADDAGFRDFGFQGSKKFLTPNLDRLAREGVVFTDAYMTASVCGPSRAGLVTGRYQQRFGYFMNPKPGQGLPLDQQTFGDALQAQGYRTGVIGKWHLGEASNEHPNERGFDYFYGFLKGHRSYFPWGNINKDQEKASNPGFIMMENRDQLDESSMDFYTTDLFTQKAIDFMDSTQEEGKPFFLFLSHNAVHGPMEALDEDLEPYKGVDKEQRRLLGGMTAALDRSTGELMDWLAASGLRENTLVVFTNDNGGGRYISANNWPLRGWKGEEWEGGIRVPMVMSWPGTLPEGKTYSEPVMSFDLFATFLGLAEGAPAGSSHAVDGVDLMPYLLGSKIGPPHEMLFWQRNHAAARSGAWKLHQRNKPDQPTTYELYDLNKDLGEKNNVIDQYPDVAERLKQGLADWQSKNAPRM